MYHVCKLCNFILCLIINYATANTFGLVSGYQLGTRSKIPFRPVVPSLKKTDNEQETSNWNDDNKIDW